MIRVMYIVQSLGLSGKTKSLVMLIKNLNREIYMPYVVCLEEKGNLAKELEDLGIDVTVANKKSGLDFCLLLRLYRLMTKKKVKIVHTYSPGPILYGGIAARLARVPIVIGTLSAFDCTIGKIKPSFYPLIDRSKSIKNKIRNKFSSYFVDKIITVSEKLGKNFINFNKISKNKLEIIPYGINVHKYSGEKISAREKRQELGLKISDLVIGMVGRLDLVKDIPTLLKSVKELIDIFPNLKLVIAGDGYMRLELESITSRLNISDKVIFLGHRTDIPEVIKVLDLFVLSSSFESFGMVLLEAMAAGKPIVATNVGCIPEIVISGKTGFLVPPKNPLLLSRAIIEILNDKKRAHLMGITGRKLVIEKYNLERMVVQYQNLYETLYFNKTGTKEIAKYPINTKVLKYETN